MKRPEYKKELFPHWHTIPVRFRDLDTLNHVNNAVFSTYYEEGRINFIRQVPELAGKLQEGYNYVLVNTKIDFISPIEFPAKLLIGTGIKKLGNSSITSFQAIYIDKTKELVSVGEASGVWFDVNNQRPARIPNISGREQFMVHSK